MFQRRTADAQDFRCRSGSGHGPYWYSRNQAAGRVTYLGRELPAHVEQAINALDQQRRVIEDKRMGLLEQAAALGRLLAAESLSDGDRAIVADLGFKTCLLQL